MNSVVSLRGGRPPREISLVVFKMYVDFFEQNMQKEDGVFTTTRFISEITDISSVSFSGGDFVLILEKEVGAGLTGRFMTGVIKEVEAVFFKNLEKAEKAKVSFCYSFLGPKDKVYRIKIDRCLSEKEKKEKTKLPKIAKSNYPKSFETFRENPDFYEELALLKAQEAIAKLMKNSGTTRTELAKALNQSKAHVTGLLSDGRNLTLRTFARICFYLKSELDFTVNKNIKK